MVVQSKLPGTFIVNLSPESISMCWKLDKTGFRSGSLIADSSYMGKTGDWYISRAFIKNIIDRNKGIGSEMLRLLKNEIIKQNGIRIIVFPGGYEEKTIKQFNFYRKNGFVNGKEKGELLCVLS